MNSSRGMTTVALVGLLAGCAATVDGAMGVPSDGGASRDAVAADAPRDASVGCEGVIEVERAGVAVPGGRRVMLDLSRTPPLPGVDPRLERVRHRALLSVVAPDDGVLAVAAQNLGWAAGALQDSNVLVSRVASCSPFALVIDEPGVMPRERLFDGQGRRFRVRRGEAMIFALDISPAFQSLSVELRMMSPRPGGALCQLTRESCPEGSVCTRDTATAEQRCVPGGIEGSACLGADPQCGAGLRCVVETGISGPVPPGDGWTACRRIRATGSPCTTGDVCPEGTACGGAGPMRCLPLGSTEAPCDERAPCGAGLICTQSRCTPTAPPGAACATDCDRELHCVRDRRGLARCRRRGDFGATCAAGSPRCAPDLRCDALRFRCLLPLPLGAACGDLLMGTCEGGHCEGGRCVRAGDRGEACRDDLDDRCNAGLACGALARCVPTRAPGSPCNPGQYEEVCADGTCVYDRCFANSGRANEGCREGRCDEGLVCVDGRCVAPLGAGETCLAGRASACGVGLRCWAGTATTGLCVFEDDDGRACGPGGACAPGRTCIEGECIAPGICDRRPTNDAPKVRCDRDRYCIYDRETAALSCVPAGRVDTPCRAGPSPCDAGASCTPAGWCRLVPGIGDACRPDIEDLCPGGSDCVNGRCVADGSGNGARCRTQTSPADACDLGLRCVEEFGRCLRVVMSCQSPLPRDRVCPADHDCALRGLPMCVPLGSLRGRCREVAPRCDEGLGCLPGGEVCVRLAGESEACDPSAETYCADGLRCVNDRCAREGLLNAPCFTGALEGRGCVSGLRCAGGRCVTAVPAGGNCDDADETKRCAERLACVDEGSGSRCRAWGSVGAPCAGNFCDLGLACIRGVCVRAADVGEVCRPWSEGGPGCAWGPCVDGRCAADGTRGGRCRHTDLACDTGLVCTRRSPPEYPEICLPPTTPVAECTADGALRCPGAASCVDERCVPDGAPGGACRVAATPRCDAPARCDPATARCAL
jgi:hypothetical protein